MQPHHLRHQLIGVGGAVKSAGAGTVVGVGLIVKHLRPADLTLDKALPGPGLVFIGNPRLHGAGRHQKHGQMAELKSAHEQTWHDFVADPEQQDAVKDIMGQADNRGHGNDVAADQAEIHARFSLGHAVTHGRNTACNLTDATGLAHCLLDQIRISAVRFMSGDQIIITGDDADIDHPLITDDRTGVTRAAGHMGQIAAGQMMAEGNIGAGLLQPLQIACSMLFAAPDDALRHLLYYTVHDFLLADSV